MRKIPTLFLRDEQDRRHVTPEVNPGCHWVLGGQGAATRKYDGTCVMLDEGGRWWARRVVKKGKAAPVHFVFVELDGMTGHAVGWQPMEQSSFARYHEEAAGREEAFPFPPGTYELVGPRVNGNPEDCDQHLLIPHAHATVLPSAPRTYEGLRDYLTDDSFTAEGIVWHHPDGRMAKLKKRDFT